MIKHLGTNVKRPKVLLCFDYQNDITYEEKDSIFVSELELFSIGTINLSLIFLETIVINTIQPKIATEIANSKVEPCCNFKGSAKIVFDKKIKVNLKDNVYPKTYYHHMLGQVQIDETLAKVQVQELHIVGWMLTK
jgi:hypothetical protein